MIVIASTIGAHVEPRAVNVSQNSAGPLLQQASSLGRRHAARMTQQELDAQLLFEKANLRAKRGLRRPSAGLAQA